jgi:hypothetical protein
MVRRVTNSFMPIQFDEFYKMDNFIKLYKLLMFVHKR